MAWMTNGLKTPITFPWEGGAFTSANIRKCDLMQLRRLAKGASLPLRLLLRAFQPPANGICASYGICSLGNREFILEMKAIKTITKIEWAQVIHYLCATRIPYALLVNFGRPEIQYDTFDLERLPASSVLGMGDAAAKPQTKRP